MRLVLYQPDIAANVGAAIRVAACFGAGLDIIEPCGFPMKQRELRRAAMDYGALAPPVPHDSWEAWTESRVGRTILLTTRADMALYDFTFEAGDALLIGRESAGVPDAVHAAADARLSIPMAPGARSLNMAVSAAVALAEAQRQLRQREA